MPKVEPKVLTKVEQAKADKKRESARLRKQKQRDKEAEITADVQVTKFDTHQVDRDQLEEQAAIRGYKSIGEYLLTLMRIDGVRIEQDQAAIGTCGSCNLPLPIGCKYVFKGQNGCEALAGLPIVEAKK